MDPHYTLTWRPGNMTVEYSSCQCGRLLHLGFIWCLPQSQAKEMVSAERGKIPFLSLVKDTQNQKAEHCWPRQCLPGSSPRSSLLFGRSHYVDHTPFQSREKFPYHLFENFLCEKISCSLPFLYSVISIILCLGL